MKRLLVLTAMLLLPVRDLYSAPSPGTKVLHDPRSGLIIHYPSDWHRDRGTAAVLLIQSFPDKQRPAQLLVPVGGASILVDARPEKTVEEVQKLEPMTAGNGYQHSSAEIELSEGRVKAVEFRNDADDVFSEGHTLIHFFTVRGRLYKTVLFYRGAKCRGTFEGIYTRLLKAIEFPR